jgi:CBS domain-containing protein
MILVVDPNPDTQQILHDYLGAEGYTVLAAPDPERARVLTCHRPLVVISEIFDARDGDRGMLRKLRADRQLEGVPLIVYSSQVFPADRNAAYASGAQAFLPKPSPLEELAGLIRSLTAPPATAAPADQPSVGAPRGPMPRRPKREGTFAAPLRYRAARLSPSTDIVPDRLEAAMKARDIMTPNPSVVTPDDLISRAAEIMRDHDVGLVPVVDDRSRMTLEGVITDRDIAIRCVAQHHDTRCRVRDHMTADHIDTVSPDVDVRDVVNKMEADRVRRIPVVDERNRLQGIIAQADIARKVGPSDPALVEEVLERISQPSAAAH